MWRFNHSLSFIHHQNKFRPSNYSIRRLRSYYQRCHSNYHPPFSPSRIATRRRIRNDQQMMMTTMSHIDLSDEEEIVIYEELKQLAKEIRHHDHLYYTVGEKPLVSDAGYDLLVQKEASICTKYPHLLQRLIDESPHGNLTTRSGRVGPLTTEEEEPGTEIESSFGSNNEISKGRKLFHLEGSPMLSLDNAMNHEEVIKWIERVYKLIYDSGDSIEHSRPQQLEILAEPKYDGLSLSIRYEKHNNGLYKLVWAATRGNGHKGEDVTDAIMEISDIPKSFTFPSNQNRYATAPDIMEIRGEVLLPKSVFHNIQKEQQENQLEQQEQQKLENSTSPKSNMFIFSNARNAASGILRRKRSAAAAVSEEEIARTLQIQSSLKFYAYDVATESLFETAMDMRDFLTQIGFTCPKNVVLSSFDYSVLESAFSPNVDTTEANDTLSSSLSLSLESKLKDTLFSHHKYLESQRESSDFLQSSKEEKDKKPKEIPFDYEMDGVVYKLNSFVQRYKYCGNTQRFPKWAIAHKFQSQSRMTYIKDIITQVGRTGVLTPIAIFEPIKVGGVTVQKASLHNFQHARRVLGISESDHDGTGENYNDEKTESFNRIRKGDAILVARAGDVIPKVVERIFHYDNGERFNDTRQESDWISLETPTECPACGSKVVYDNIVSSSSLGNEEEGEEERDQIVPRCSNSQFRCRPRALQGLAHSFSRGALEVYGLSESKLTQLYEEGIFQTPSDLFSLSSDKDKLHQISELKGWGKKSTQNLGNALQEVLRDGVSLQSFIYSLGIRHVGYNNAELLASAFQTSDNFIQALQEASYYTDTTISKNTDDANRQSIMIERILLGESNTNSKKQNSTEVNNNGDNIEEISENNGIKGVGQAVINSLKSFAQDETLLKAAITLNNVLLIHNHKNTMASQISSTIERKSPFSGKTIVFTGSITSTEDVVDHTKKSEFTRREAQQIAKDILGATSTPSAISKNTDIVVLGEKAGKKKRDDIERINEQKDTKDKIKVISAQEFINMVHEFSNTDV